MSHTEIPSCQYAALAIPGLVSLHANISSIQSFPLVSRLYLPDRYPDSAQSSLISLRYIVDKLQGMPRSPGGKFFHCLDDQTLYFELPIGGFGKIKIKLIWDDFEPILLVNPTFHRFSRTTIGTVHSAGQVLRDIVNIALLKNGYCLLHGAGVALAGKTALLVGLSNTGKTTTVLDLVKNHDARYYGDDLVVSDGTNLFPCPYTRLNVDRKNAPSLRYRTAQWIRRKIPFAENFSATSLSLYEYLGARKMASQGRITDIFLLSNDDIFTERSISKDEAARLLYASNQVEFTYNTSQLVWASEYLGAGIPARQCAENEFLLCRALVKSANVHHMKGDAAELKSNILRCLRKC